MDKLTDNELNKLNQEITQPIGVRIVLIIALQRTLFRMLKVCLQSKNLRRLQLMLLLEEARPNLWPEEEGEVEENLLGARRGVGGQESDPNPGVIYS